MSVEWYDMIAKRNGGYKSDAVYSVEGNSGEYEFEERLTKMLPNFDSVLDSGCGHGEFTLKMSRYAKSLIGFDNSSELLKVAKAILSDRKDVDNVDFVYASTKTDLPFDDNQFDLIYTRRGPTSALNHSRILKPDGTVFGIHSAEKERVEQRLNDNGFIDITFEVYDEAFKCFPTEKEFTKYLSSMHGRPDYTLPENQAELQQLIAENTVDGQLKYKEWRYIWMAKKPK